MEQEKLNAFQSELTELLKKHGVEIFPQMTIGVKEIIKEDATEDLDSKL